MDQKLHEGEPAAMRSSSQSMLATTDKSCLDSSTPVKKSHISASQQPDAGFVSPTPVKTDETLNIRCKKEPAKLPEKYRTLSEFFERMTTSLRLLNLRKQLPTFQNICRQVETLTRRKFLHRHLAQIKFIFPEAVQADKIILHNKKTLSMEPDLKVTLLFDVIEGHLEHSPYLALCQAFSDRLFKFVSTHPEGYDVPEAELPEPFNQREITISANSLSEDRDSSVETPPKTKEAELLNPSHLHTSFSRNFSRKDVEETTKTEVSPPPVLASSIIYDTTPNKKTGFPSCLDDTAHQVANGETPMKSPLVSDGLADRTCLQPSFSRDLSREDVEEPTKTDLSSTPPLPSFVAYDTKPNKETGHSSCSDDKALQVANGETPMKPPLASDDLTVETPNLSTPKRSVPTEESKLKSMVSQKGMVSNMFTKRSLDFSNDDDGVFLEEKTKGASISLGKVEDKSYRTSKNDSVTQSGPRADQHTSSCLSDLVETVFYIFRSANCSLITKNELVYKILVNNLDVMENGEIEEQIKLLVDKVPDWISTKVAPSGDLLYSINKGLDLKSVTEKLT